jgi:regulator of cell morphogenesis and NO signaling
MIHLLEEKTIGEMVAEDYRKAEVFKRNGIDFCCGGKKTVAEVCQQKGIDPGKLASELKALEQPSGGGDTYDINQWPLPLLIDYIVGIHHRYVRETMPRISEYAQKVARVHGHAWPENVEIANIFTALHHELHSHMMKEEEVLFPYIKRLSEASERHHPSPAAPFGTVGNPIRMMESEHEEAGEAMASIRRLSRDFHPPEAACNTYRVLYKLLEEFESDLHRHVHLENNILHPRALALEQSLHP